MAHLKLFFLGPPRLEQEGQRLDLSTQKSMALLAYLAVTGQAHRREALTTLLWPRSKPRQARSILRTTLWTLNKSLTGEALQVERDRIGLNREADIWLDVAHFRRLAESGQGHDHVPDELCDDCLAHLAEAATIYRGDFLEGFTLRDSASFDDWQTFETEGLRRELGGVLEKLGEAYRRQGHFDIAIGYAQRRLTLDSLHEPAHRQLMQLYAESGNRSAALRQYQTCCELLEDELEARPEAETTALYERIRQETAQRVMLIGAVYGIVEGDTPQGLAKSLLGQGGMGNVYRGLDTRSGNPVAIKRLKPEIVAANPTLVERFVREGEALRQLNHPNIVKLLAAVEQDGQHYLVMEYVEGGSLRDLIKRDQPLSISRILEIALDLADALTRAHRLNIIHRDLKPANVLLAHDGTPRLTDFGIARLTDSSQITESGLLVGTLNYLSPEGCDGHPLDERADIWAFGVVLFEMLIGERPFNGETASAVLAAIVTQPTPDLNQYRSDIPPPLADVVYRMLLKDREQRLPSVRLVGAELEAILADRPLTPTSPLPAPAGPPPPCPYRGLFAFQEEDAPFFFGRETFTASLVEAVQNRGLVAVIGPSGSGKSSVVQAGLAAQLRQEAGWLIDDFRPGSDPFGGLAATLLPLLEPDLGVTDQLVELRKLAESLQSGQLPLADVIDKILQQHPEASRFLLVADQFEELYTLCPEAELRYNFLDLLFEIIDLQQYQTEPSFTLVFTLRADFLEQALAHRPLADIIQGNDFKLGPMLPEELGLAVERPAEKQGVAFESGLVDRILDDVGEEPGNLPLLEFALTTLWEQQSGRRLSHTDYESIARVEGALTRHADAVYAALSPAERERARRLFTQLVRPGEGTEDTRRLARRAELNQADWALAQKLADARLVVTGQDAAGNETLEVVHEALIRSWIQLRRWMAADRSFRTWQERLRAALRQWEATDQDEGALLRGLSLAEAENWLGQRADELSETERSYIEASLELRERSERERENQRRRELEAAQNLAETEARAVVSLRKRAMLLGGVGLVAVVLAIVAALFGLQSSQNAAEAQANAEIAAAQEATAQANANLAAAQEATAQANAALAAAQEAEAVAAEATALAERDRADAERDTAVSRQLAIQVADQLEVGNFEAATLLAIEAARLDENVETWAALRQAMTQPRPLLLTLSGMEFVNDVRWNAAESLILTASDDALARLWDAESGEEVQLFAGHTEWIKQVQWNSDESRILTASADGTARVWDVVTGDALMVLTGHTDWVNSAVWSSDESRILTASDDGTVRVWDAETGKDLMILSDHTEFVGQALWNAAESRILSASADGTARVWDAATGDELLVLAGHEDAVRQAIWNADESRILTAGFDGAAKVWDSETGDEVLTLSGHTSFIWQAIWNADESLILTSSADNTARVWDAESGDDLLILTGHTALIKQAAWNADENLLLTASEDGTARVWDAETGQELAAYGHGAEVGVAAWNRSGDRILTAASDGTARVWSAKRQDPQPELPVLFGPAGGETSQALWSRDERLILTNSADINKPVQVWEAATGQELYSLPHGSGVNQALWNADESLILTAGDDGVARVWDVVSKEELIALAGHSDWVWRARWNAAGTRILTAGKDGVARIWDADTGEELFALTGHSEWINQASWDPDERRILTASDDGTARVWDAETGEELLAIAADTGKVLQAHWSADGSRILTATEDGTARVWDAASGEEILRFSGHIDRVNQALWNSDESRILTAGGDGTARVWDAQTGEELLTLAGHSDWVWQATWNADESKILTAGWDGTARVWDAETGAALVVFDDHTDFVWQADWNRDGSRILTASFDGTARQYYSRLEDLIAAGCERATRNLTPAEWQQFMGEQPYRSTCPGLPALEE